jgi:hypothetical protein
MTFDNYRIGRNLSAPVRPGQRLVGKGSVRPPDDVEVWACAGAAGSSRAPMPAEAVGTMRATTGCCGAGTVRKVLAWRQVDPTQAAAAGRRVFMAVTTAKPRLNVLAIASVAQAWSTSMTHLGPLTVHDQVALTSFFESLRLLNSKRWWG